MDIRQTVRNYIAKNLLFSDTFPFGDEVSFLTEGIIDSIGVMELVAFVGQEFKINVEADEVTPDNFDSVQRISDFVARKQAGAR